MVAEGIQERREREFAAQRSRPHLARSRFRNRSPTLRAHAHTDAAQVVAAPRAQAALLGIQRREAAVAVQAHHEPASKPQADGEQIGHDTREVEVPHGEVLRSQTGRVRIVSATARGDHLIHQRIARHRDPLRRCIVSEQTRQIHARIHRLPEREEG